MSTHDVEEPGDSPDMPEAARDEHPRPEAPSDTESADFRQERDELHDRLLRKTAEFDNYRKRVDRERRELNEWAAADVLGELLTVIDDLDRALAADAPAGAETYRAGVELIARQLKDLLRKRGVTPIEALGADFDPHVHQAVAYDEEPGAREGEIVGEMRKGYKIGDRLLRPAMVKVAKAS
ncbi:MAG: nucleotide exchange factor GrpE [Vicinamibacterales bacterium]